MHTIETKNQFIELRVKGLSLARIAGRLKVNKRTLIEWNRQSQDEIHHLRTVEFEALRAKIIGSYKHELEYLGFLRQKIRAVLSDRTFKMCDSERLLELDILLRREIREFCTNFDTFDKPPTPPNNPVQTEKPDPQTLNQTTAS